MTSKNSNRDDLDLSLTGSQVGTPTSSGRRPGSAKSAGRPNSSASAGARNKPPSNVNGVANGSSRRRTSSGGYGVPLSGRSDVSAGDSTRSRPKASARDDFLALFENSTQPKVMKPKATQKTKPAWASNPNSARSTATADSGRERQSHVSSKGSKFSHSIFQPTSARSSSTVDEEEEEHYGNLNLNLSSLKSNNNNNSSSSPGRDASVRSKGARTPDKPPSQLAAVESVRTDPDFSSRTYSAHGGNEFVNSADDAVSQKATKLNSIANNMTSQAFSPGAKAPLHSMENSYQNIKHKTPVNQVRQSPQSPQAQVGRNAVEDYVKRCNMAATKVQRWYKRHINRRKHGEAAMRRLLDSKRQEKEEQLHREQTHNADRDSDRKKSREEKARQARQQAITELQRKREEKRQENQRIAEEEIRYLQASGKVSKTAANRKQALGAKNKGAPDVARAAGSDSSDDHNQHSMGRPSTGGSTSRQVDDFFQSGNVRASVPNNTREEPTERAAVRRSVGSEADDTAGGMGVAMPATPSQAATKTTLDDLMETLKKLEEEDKFPTARGKDKNQKPLNWLDDLERSEADKDEAEEFLCAERLQTLSSKDNLKKSGMLTDEKLRSIITYLDDVDKAERLSEIDQELQRVNQTLDRPALLVPSGEELAQLDQQATAAVSEVGHTIVAQKMELEDKKRSVQMLQKALAQQRELTVRHAKETEKDMKKRLELQKDEYEDTVKRHLSFIDQLIDDKKNLGEKCENLVRELKTIDKKYQDTFKSLHENHDVELRKIKEIQAAAEKLRREKWIDEKTKKIKEMTVKGLEPEIQRLIAKHKAELKKIKSIHEAELLASDERAGGRYIKMTEELRDQLAQEKEMACGRERELARQTFEKQMQQEEEAFQQQRRRLYGEVQEEKERVAQQAARQRTELDRLQRQLEDTHSQTSMSTRKEYEKAREEQERRHTAEVRQLREQLTLEKTAWEENYMKKQETWLVQKERELKDQVRRDRDKEIELVIQRLEEDNQAAREECERVAENRIKRIRDKYEAEISELERSEKLTSEKYNQTKAQLAEMEGENQRIKVTLKQKDRDVNELKKLLDKLNDERDRVSDVIRQEFADRIVATEEECRKLKNSMSELKAKHRMELDRGREELLLVQKAKDEEMEEVHQRVKQAIVKKEDVVTQMKQQHDAAVKRADHLEGLLEQQRKQLLSLGGRK